MARIITEELAQKIAKKLSAQVVKSGGAHDIAYIYFNDQLVAEFGIRRAPDKDLGHDHVPRDLHISPSQAKRLGQCPLKVEQYFQILADKGLIELPTTEDEED